MDAITTQPVSGLEELSVEAASRVRDERAVALRDALAAFFSSRLIVWVAGVIAVLAVGFFPGGAPQLDPAHLTAPFHARLLNILVSPASRWDAAWYVSIAKTGYILSYQTVFFPLYPALIALGGAIAGNGSDIVIGILVSCVCAIAALYLLHRLVSLEFDQRVARNTVWIFAWLPTAVVLSAVYSEALFLVLAVGCFYAARLGRWGLACLIGALAAATRNSGVLLLLPLLILYFYGPRSDRETDFPANGWRPRYRLQPDLLWMALVPMGLVAYLVYLQLAIGHPMDPFVHQQHWGRHFIPLGAIPLGLWSVVRSVSAVIPGVNPNLLSHMTFSGAMRHVYAFVFLILALALLRESWKRLPVAYTAFALASLVMALSVPASSEPLKSFPRFTLVMFPLWIALALWATERNRVRAVLAVSAPFLVLSTYLFVTWSWTP